MSEPSEARRTEIAAFVEKIGARARAGPPGNAGPADGVPLVLLQHEVVLLLAGAGIELPVDVGPKVNDAAVQTRFLIGTSGELFMLDDAIVEFHRPAQDSPAVAHPAAPRAVFRRP